MINNIDLKGVAVSAPNVAGAGGRPATLEFDVAHHLPGRMRLRSAALKGKVCANDRVRHHLAQISGVTAASSNPITGSVLLEYDTNLLPPGQVISALAEHGYLLRAHNAAAEAGGRWADKIASAATEWVINALAERLAIAVVVALA